MTAYDDWVDRIDPDCRIAVRQLFPSDFEHCGCCGGKTRELTEPESASILLGLASLGYAFPASEVLCAAIWPIEIMDRRVCECTWRVRESMPLSGFFVYHLWTENRRLLYVGSTTRLRARIATHRRRWPDLVRDVEWDEYDTVADMLAAEQAAIRDEMPALNKQGV